MYGWGFANTFTFAFMHHPFLVCILIGMPSLHLFTFLMLFIFLLNRNRTPSGKKLKKLVTKSRLTAL